jgi:hypothetical protein
MRKLLIAALALAAVVAVSSAAYATNVYTVSGSTTVKGKGSRTKPIPTGIKLQFDVTDTDSTMRGTVVEKYALGGEGVVANPKFFPKCAFSDMDNEATVPGKCRKALVGTGIAKNAAGDSRDRSLQNSSPCNLQVRLYNNGSGMIIRLDGGPPPPSSFDSNEFGCLLPIHTAINGKFVKRKIGGLPTSDFTFTVPQNLKHPLTGIDNSIRRSVSNVKLKTKIVKGKKRGFYEKIGCKGKTRVTRGKFVSEATATQSPQTFTDTDTAKC